MASRYSNRELIRNVHPRYTEYFGKRTDNTITRATRGVVQWTTAEISYPTDEELAEFSIIDHVWKQGDNLYKLAHQHYGDVKLWWVIAWFNKKPLLSDYALGDLVYIPFPLSEVYSYFL